MQVVLLLSLDHRRRLLRCLRDSFTFFLAKITGNSFRLSCFLSSTFKGILFLIVAPLKRAFLRFRFFLLYCTCFLFFFSFVALFLLCSSLKINCFTPHFITKTNDYGISSFISWERRKNSQTFYHIQFQKLVFLLTLYLLLYSV